MGFYFGELFTSSTKLRNRHTKDGETKKSIPPTHSVEKLQRELTTSRLGKDQLSRQPTAPARPVVSASSSYSLAAHA